MSNNRREPHWVKDMPYVFWFCICFAWLFANILIYTHFHKTYDLSTTARNLLMLVFFVPWLWFIGVRVFGSDDS